MPGDFRIRVIPQHQVACLDGARFQVNIDIINFAIVVDADEHTFNQVGLNNALGGTQVIVRHRKHEIAASILEQRSDVLPRHERMVGFKGIGLHRAGIGGHQLHQIEKAYDEKPARTKHPLADKHNCPLMTKNVREARRRKPGIRICVPILPAKRTYFGFRQESF